MRCSSDECRGLVGEGEGGSNGGWSIVERWMGSNREWRDGVGFPVVVEKSYW